MTQNKAVAKRTQGYVTLSYFKQLCNYVLTLGYITSYKELHDSLFENVCI